MSNESAASLRTSSTCTSFLKTVQRHLSKHNALNSPSAQKKAISIAKHGCHILQTLLSKRQSLQSAVAAWKQCSSSFHIPAIREACQDKQGKPNPAIIRHVLHHWIHQYVRLRDCLVLLQSGECRHPPDQKLAMSSSSLYSSHLSNSKRNDGYTTLFSADYYCGYGWDEMFDEENGVKTRLCACLLECGGTAHVTDARVERVWGKLTERCDIEEKFDVHEVEVKDIVEELERVKKWFLYELNSMHCAHDVVGKGKIIMVVEDKHERLEVHDKFGILELRMERKGNNFQINDKEGVLPVMVKDRWMEVFKLPPVKFNNEAGKGKSQGKTLKRRIIVEEDDEDEDEEGNTIDVHMVTHSLNTTKPQESNEDLGAIKEHFGVDPKGLQASREILEQEILDAENDVEETSATMLMNPLSDNTTSRKEQSGPSVFNHNRDSSLAELLHSESSNQPNFPHRGFSNSKQTTAPTGRMTISTGKRKGPIADDATGGASSNIGFGTFNTSTYEEQPSSHRPHIQYRKWGDELLQQVEKEGGGMEMLIQYPACAPEMPPHMRIRMLKNR